MKVLFLGDLNVGKTSLIWKFVYKAEFQTYTPTLGADFHNKSIQRLDHSDGLTKKVKMQLWDTAG